MPDSDQSIDFFVNQTTNDKTDPIRVPINDVSLFAEGIFDGASVRIEISPDIERNPDPELMSWFTKPEATFTDATTDPVKFWENADLCEGWVRAVQEDSTLNTNITFRMRPRTENSV